MKFTSAQALEQVIWQMRLADYPRSLNRSRIDDLFNGVPPYSSTEVQQNNISTNVNFLESTKIAHDARRQFYNAFSVPDPVFFITVDRGPQHKRQQWSMQLTKIMAKIMKENPFFHELQRSQFASLVLHGIGPAIWEDKYSWCPTDVGVEDVLVPANTLCSMRNLMFRAVFRQYTSMELWEMTHKPNVDPGWNLPAVESAIKWADNEARLLMGTSWPETWSPEKMSERIKSDGGLYASDVLPTIDCFDFLFWDDDGKRSGWKRRIILDAWGSPGVGGSAPTKEMPDKVRFKEVDDFLYNSKDRIYCDNLAQSTHWQFADASSVAPFRYHSVRSVGFLLYAVCHLQNRLRCKFNDAVFENMLQYFRVSNPTDMDRVQRINLVDKGVIEEGVNFVKQDERHQFDHDIVSQAMQLNRQTMSDNSASFTQDFDMEKEGEETATRTMAKVNATAALVGAMLSQAYNYQVFQYREMARRFCMKNSRDPDVRKFRSRCLKEQIPVEILDSECWDISPNRVIGGGNKTLQIAIADKLMGVYDKLDPDSQRDALRIYIATNSDDYAKADMLVPERKTVSDATLDGQRDTSVLLDGLWIEPRRDINYVDYVEAMLAEMGFVVQKIEAAGGMTNPDRLQGLQNLGKYISRMIQQIAQDESQKGRVKKYNDALSGLMNRIKAYEQRLQKQSQEQNGNGNGGLDPKDQAKIQAIMAQAKVKADNQSKSHAQRTAERQIQFEQQMKQDEQKHRLELQKTGLEHRHGLMNDAIETAHNIEINRMKSTSENDE